MYKIKFDFPNLPKGAEIDITGLHVQNDDGSQSYFKNGHEYVIDKAMADAYRAQSPVVSVDEKGHATFELGPTLLEAFKDSKSVTVTTVQASTGGDK